MRSCIRALTLTLILLPRISSASVLEIHVNEPMILLFGPSGAQFSGADVISVLLDGAFIVDGAFQPIEFDLPIEFEAGPLQSLTLTSDALFTRSHYVFGPGSITLTAHWIDEFGIPAEGSFVAPLLSLEVDLCEQELSTGICDPVWDESAGQFIATFGPGLFDPSLAHALRIAPRGDLSPFVFPMDAVSGGPFGPFSDVRFGGSARGTETLEIDVTVPEPSALSLLLISSFAALRAGRMRGRRPCVRGATTGRTPPREGPSASRS